MRDRRRSGDPVYDVRDQPFGQVVARIERFGIMAGTDQMDCVPSLTQGLQVVRDGEVSPIAATGGLGSHDQLFAADMRQ